MCKAWKLQNYVLCLLFFLSMFVLICMIIVGAVAYQQVEERYTKGSELLIVKENNRSSTRLQYLTIRNISLIVNRSLRQLVNNNYVYQYSQALNYQYIQPPRACMNNQSEVDTYSFNSSVCYGFYGNQTLQITEQDKKLLNFTALMSMTLLVQDVDSFYYASTQKKKLLGRHQGQYLPGFDPQTRPWYVTFMSYKGNSLTTFTTPYYSLSNQNYLISQSTALRNLNGSIAGVMSGQLILSDILKSQQQNMNITIFDQSGLIYNVGQQNSTQIHLQNESYTGFNQSQSETILLRLNDPEPIILFNSLYDQDVQVKSEKLYKIGLFLLFQTNPTYQKSQVNRLIKEIQESLLMLYIQTTLIFIFVVLFVIVISIVTLILSFRSLKNIELLMKNTYNQNNFKTLKANKQENIQVYISQLQILQDAFTNMVQHITDNKNINQEALQMNDQVEYLIKPPQSRIGKQLIRHLKQFIIYSSVMSAIISFEEEPQFRDQS